MFIVCPNMVCVNVKLFALAVQRISSDLWTENLNDPYPGHRSSILLINMFSLFDEAEFRQR